MPDSSFLDNARQILENSRKRKFSLEERITTAISLASWMLKEAKRIQTPYERQQQAELARMLNDSKGKIFTTYLTDRCFRSQDNGRAANQLVHLINTLGIPKFFTFFQRLQLRAFYWLGKAFANLLVPLVKKALHHQTSNVILPGEPDQLAKHIGRRRQEGVHVNLNHLGEAILGENEAAHRLEIYLKDLANPEIECISIKISTIYSQISLLGWEHSLSLLSERLKKLYRVAKQHLYTCSDGTKIPKFINLDMEEYRDLHLTVELFKKVLDDPEFHQFRAGIVLQSYLPDSFNIQKNLTEWALQRMEGGGAPIKIRIVKGANLAMEKVEASLRDWPQAPYLTKSDVDANYKRMVTYGCQRLHAQAVNLGIASHNLFDISYALILRAENHSEEFICFEMLEGMADHMRRVVQKLSGNMLLYCPAATKEEFQNAVAYLVRRLDENTAPENFLRHAFNLNEGNTEWEEQASFFVTACRNSDTPSKEPSRQQNRLEEPIKVDTHTFHNDADTDWSLPQNCKWAEKIRNEWKDKTFDIIPLVIGKQSIRTDLDLGIGQDPSYPEKILYRYTLGGKEQLEIAVQTSAQGFNHWSSTPLTKRLNLLANVAHEMQKQRADLIGAMVADTGKTVVEADVEISEAIDFIEYYRLNAAELHLLHDIKWTPKGPTLVAPPWNFPCSIPTGGISAALAAGNSVIFKPAPEAVLVGWILVNIFWKAGIEKDILQFFCCPDDPIGSHLIEDQRIAVTILTGATSTAKHFLGLRPNIDLMAETGGKNAMIITKMADRDLAIKDLVQSAFGHSGQKCSACSLAILEKEVYDDPNFRRQLQDAAASLKVGLSWDFSSRVIPLIHPPGVALNRALTTLDEGEEWLLKPKPHPENRHLWSPGIKYGVKPGSFMHQTELFGPVLAVMCANDLDDAIEIANSTPYGLTSGIHTLDEREQIYWIEGIHAGNCYINRGITGAIVQRQPFGGCKASSFGPGIKAGGPNYVMQLMLPEQISLPNEQEEPFEEIKELTSVFRDLSPNSPHAPLWEASIGSYTFFWNRYFSEKHDPSKVRGQDNYLCYVPHRHQHFRIQDGDQPIDILRAIAAIIACEATVEISYPVTQSEMLSHLSQLPPYILLIEETENAFIDKIAAGEVKRLRLLKAPNPTFRYACALAACNVIVAPIIANGRIELMRWLQEVSISWDYHRYGYLGEREKQEQPKTCCSGSGCCCG